MEAFIEQLKSMDRNQLILTAAQLKKASLPEAIAVVGIGCRFPGGVHDPASFWDLVVEGRDSVSNLDDQRWRKEQFFSPRRDMPGRTYVNHMALVEDPDRFDAELFGISRQEAELMDPQQRWLLEVSWHALEDAGIAPTGVKGQSGGVFVGLMNHDYEQLQHVRGDFDTISGYTAVGNSMAVAAGRLSYFFGLRGPSLALDTACSSSLVSVHLACQALRNKECEFALAGGVNAILSPTTTIAESKALMLSPSGHCHTYDAAADGYVRGEGCGMIVLKRLSDARKAGDRIYAVIRGSAVNQDGNSQGLTAPNGLSQQAVIGAALRQASVSPDAVGFVETHGTGTPLGDPIEIGALLGSYGAASRAVPLQVSTVKTNFGHTESAAGIAGLIKLVLARQHGVVPKLNRFQTLNPHIQLDASKLTLPLENQPWPVEAPFGGVSSFGFSGTNAHIIVGSAPAPAQSVSVPPAQSEYDLICLSAQHAQPLQELEQRYADELAQTSDSAALAAASRKQRAHLKQRTAWVVKQGRVVDSFSGALTSRVPLTAWMFSGQGSQHAGMAKGLYHYNQVFRASLDECAAHLDKLMPHPLYSLLWGEHMALLDDARYTQPAIFAVEVALSRMWQAQGVKPDYLVGHSFGEYAAACLADVFSLEDGIRLIWARASSVADQCERGGMVAIKGDLQTAQSWLEDLPQLRLAAINTANSHVLAGPLTAIEQLLEALTEQGVGHRRLSVSHAFHTPMMQAMQESFLAVARTVEYRRPRIPFVSTMTGKVETDLITTPEYWARHILSPVRFAAAVDTALQQRVKCWFEVGPSVTLNAMARQCVEQESEHTWIWSMKEEVDDARSLLIAMARLYCAGHEVDLGCLDAGIPVRQVDLPKYPFRSTRYWFEAERSFAYSASDGAQQADRAASAQASEEEQADSRGQQLAAALATMDTEEQWLTLVNMTRSALARVLEIEEEEIPLDADLFDLGIDSMKALDLRASVQKELGYELSATLLFDYPNVLSLVDYMGIELLQLWSVSPLAEEAEAVTEN